VGLEQPHELDQAGLTVGPSRECGAEPDRRDASFVESRSVPTGRVVEIGPAAGHAGPEVGPDRSQNDDDAPGHVFAAVWADPLHHRLRAAVADREAHPRPADQMEPARRRPIEHGVAGDRFGRRCRPEVGFRCDSNRPARQTLGHVVVGLPDQPEIDAMAGEGPERLPGGTPQLELDRAVELAALEGAGQAGAERAIGGREAETGSGDRTLATERRRDRRFELGCRRMTDLATGGGRVCTTDGTGGPWRAADDGTELRSRGRDGSQQTAALADDLADRTCADRGKLAAEVFRDRGEVAHDVVGSTGEFGAQVLALGRDPGRARVEVALAGHVAADGH
jgi:hypothetical protein